MHISTRIKVLTTLLSVAGVLLGIGVNYKNGGLAGLRELTFDTIEQISKLFEHSSIIVPNGPSQSADKGHNTQTVRKNSGPPERVSDSANLRYFSATGDPLVWYYKSSDGIIELFDRPGNHPRYNVALRPITEFVVAVIDLQYRLKTVTTDVGAALDSQSARLEKARERSRSMPPGKERDEIETQSAALEKDFASRRAELESRKITISHQLTAMLGVIENLNDCMTEADKDSRGILLILALQPTTSANAAQVTSYFPHSENGSSTVLAYDLSTYKSAPNLANPIGRAMADGVAELYDEKYELQIFDHSNKRTDTVHSAGVSSVRLDGIPRDFRIAFFRERDKENPVFSVNPFMWTGRGCFPVIFIVPKLP
jgi:hypothetical protein